MSSGFSRASVTDPHWDFELRFEVPEGGVDVHELTVRVRAATFLMEGGALSVVFARRAATYEAAVGGAVLDVLGLGLGLKLLSVDDKPKRMILSL